MCVQSSLKSKKELLISQNSAAVGSQHSVGYELHADIGSKTDRLHTCATDSMANK